MYVENLEVFYTGVQNRLKVLDKITFSLQKGEILTLLGESGSGKTTCGKALLGMLPPSAKITGGLMRLGNGAPVRLNDREVNWHLLRGRQIAMIYQDARLALNPVKTVREHFHGTLAYHKLGSKAAIERKSAELLQFLRFDDPACILASYPFELSGGMCQRVYTALILCLEPEILIADEPTSALDPDGRQEVISLLKQVQQSFSLSILLITHDIDVAAALGGRIIVLENGRIIETGSTNEILTRPKEPYTRSLLEARELPVRDAGREKRSGAPLLLVENLCKTFKNKGAAYSVLQDVCLEVYRGESIGLLGASGCGKSTLAKCITGLERADRGSIIYHGKDITHVRGSERKWVCKHMQMVFQDARASLNPQRSALQLVQEPLEYLGIGNKRERIEKARSYLQQVQLDNDAQQRRPPQLSTGQCQRIALARALIVEPDILICDEAVSALDMVLQKQILCLLDSLQNALGFAVIMISHDIRIIRHYCTLAAVMQNGVITGLIPTDRLAAHENGDALLLKAMR
ncbi:MAG: ABC transporter ATP-binding protein [Treponema sp.]